MVAIRAMSNKGPKRPGVPGAGRPSGHWKKAIEAAIREANERGEPLTALQQLQLIAAQPDLPFEKRVQVLKLTLPHESPRLSAVDVSTTRRISVDELDTEQLQAFAAKLMRSASDKALDITPRIVDAAPLPTREKP